jgi:hypothetical protein
MARKQNKRVAEKPKVSPEDVSDDNILPNELSDDEDQPEQRLFDPNDYEPSQENENNSEEDEPSDEEAELEMLAALQAQREQEAEQRPTIDNHVIVYTILFVFYYVTNYLIYTYTLGSINSIGRRVILETFAMD